MQFTAIIVRRRNSGCIVFHLHLSPGMSASKSVISISFGSKPAPETILSRSFSPRRIGVHERPYSVTSHFLQNLVLAPILRALGRGARQFFKTLSLRMRIARNHIAYHTKLVKDKAGVLRGREVGWAGWHPDTFLSCSPNRSRGFRHQQVP